MQSFFAKCAAVGIVAGGFTLTGDLGRLADRGRRLLDATGVPTDQASARAPDHVAPSGDPHGVAATPPTAAPAAAPPSSGNGTIGPSATTARGWRLPGDAPADAPIGRPVAPLPSSGGRESVDLRTLTAGTRLLVWVCRAGGGGPARDERDVIALDIIDPSTGAALEHRHAAVSAGGRATIHSSPRRVVIPVDPTSLLTRGEPLRLAPVSGVNGAGTVEVVGRVVAIDLATP